jgi:octanoyl-[GcvH]:protein N-octanoyltransferase
MDHTIALMTDAFPDRPGLDTAVSRVLLRQVSDGDSCEVFRLRTPPRVVAFGKRDRLESGYAEAIRAAKDHGFGAIERLAGGRAAVFHEGTLAFGWTIPSHYPPAEIKSRFEMLDTLVASALRRLGLSDVRVGEVPGEYCPGEYSINVGGTHKVMGVGQRLAKHAAHVGGVIVVRDATSIREVLVPVYEHLGLAWIEATTGALENFVPSLSMETVRTAILSELSTFGDLLPTSLSQETVTQAVALLPDHLPNEEHQ